MPYCRLDIFKEGYGYQGWNPDPVMEEEMARLQGSGSFYWDSPKSAYKAASRFMRRDPAIEQIKIETISGREVGRLYRWRMQCQNETQNQKKARTANGSSRPNTLMGSSSVSFANFLRRPDSIRKNVTVGMISKF